MDDSKAATTAARLKELARQEAFRIGRAIGSNEDERDRRLVAHKADPSLARKRVETYVPLVGNELRCPSCWVLEEKISPLDKDDLYRPEDKEQRRPCSVCTFEALLPYEGD